MAITALNKVKTSGQLTDVEKIGKKLFDESLAHFTHLLGQRDLGFSYNSCNAAVAIEPNVQYNEVEVGGVRFSVVFGSSRLFSGLDSSFNSFHQNISPGRPFSNSREGEHAEQAAIRVVENLNLGFWSDGAGDNHIYIDLSPCNNCYSWLRNDARNWQVHYYTELDRQAPIVNLKKRERSAEFGRQLEPKKPKF